MVEIHKFFQANTENPSYGLTNPNNSTNSSYHCEYVYSPMWCFDLNILIKIDNNSIYVFFLIKYQFFDFIPEKFERKTNQTDLESILAPSWSSLIGSEDCFFFHPKV